MVRMVVTLHTVTNRLINWLVGWLIYQLTETQQNARAFDTNIQNRKNRSPYYIINTIQTKNSPIYNSTFKFILIKYKWDIHDLLLKSDHFKTTVSFSLKIRLRFQGHSCESEIKGAVEFVYSCFNLFTVPLNCLQFL